MRKALFLLLVLAMWLPLAEAAEPIAIPIVFDPMPVIDGNLQDWAGRGALREWKQPEQVTFGREVWQGVEDLSGWVRIGYDQDHLYVAAHVVDSVFLQNQSGRPLWQGDHIIGLADFIGSGKKEDVITFGLSPGNLKAPDDPGPDIKPELVIWRPANASVEGASVAARRTETGYDLEAAIPWKLLNVQPAKAMTFGLELALSDCDQSPPIQETCISIATAKWTPWDPKRLIRAGLGDRSGYLPPHAFQKAQVLAENLSLKQGQAREFVVNVEAVPEGLIPTLTFKSRIHSDRAAGCSGPLRILVNHKNITQDNIANRPRHMTSLSGIQLSAWCGVGVRLWFGPSFDAIEKSPYKPLDVIAYDYTLRLDKNKLIRPGKNTITFQYEDPRDLEIILSDLAFSWSPPSRFTPPKVWQPAPKGALPTIEPETRHKTDYQVTSLSGGALKVAWSKRQIIVESRFSRPGGQWGELKQNDSPGWESTGHTPGFSGVMGDLQITRSFIPQDECILVSDILQNNSREPLPVKITHRVKPGAFERLRLSGRPAPQKSGASSVPSNPTVAVMDKETGFGLMARDDVFRAHCRAFCDKDWAGLTDNNLVLAPGATYRHEWLIVPLRRSYYWDFPNALRRHFGTNFSIPGSFCFFDLSKEHLNLLPWEIADYVDRKAAYYVCVSLGVRYKGHHPHGPVRRTLDVSKAQTTNKVIRVLRPDAKLLTYFNCFNVVHVKGDPVRWMEDRVMCADGTQLWGGTPLAMYFPTLTNPFGKEMDKDIEWMLNTVGADGIYWDCYNYSSVAHYGDEWDGWSGDIDPRKHTLIRKKSFLLLLSWPWKEKATANLLQAGRPLVANGNPDLTSEYKYQFPRFVEAADITRLTQTQLFTPIALGDHITERNEVDAYRWMLNALEWGGLYYWYSSRIVPSHPTLTTYMFPITPMELHSGYIIGKERILTKNSGHFGWGDESEFKVHVFDRVGRETDKIKTTRTVRNHKATVELRLPEGYAAAIVRKP